MRRLHIQSLDCAVNERVQLPASEAHHARDVLRLEAGDDVELFDDAGNVAQATIEKCDASVVEVIIRSIATSASADRATLTVAAAIPKGDRADWMIEKLSEIGVSVFVPLITERSVVVPAGLNKFERWRRLATEAAKQSRRTGVMRIEPLVTFDEWLKQPRDEAVGILSTEGGSIAMRDWLGNIPAERGIALLIGPEGGWTERELAESFKHRITAIKMTATILRVETAAVVAAGIVASR